MKFMHNDNSKSLQAKSVLVKADRVAAGMNLVSSFPITPTRLSTRDWCEMQAETCYREPVETTSSQRAIVQSCTGLTTENLGDRTLRSSSSSSDLIQEQSWHSGYQSQLGKIPSAGILGLGTNPVGPNDSSDFGTGPLEDHAIQNYLMGVIRHDGSANLPVGKQTQQKRFLNGFQDENFRSKQNRLRRSISSNQKSLGISL